MSVEATLTTRVATRLSEQWYEDLWEHDPTIHRLLQESESLEVGREKLFNYLKGLEWRYRCGQLDGHKLDWATAMEALKVFCNILSPRNEQIAGFGTLTYLWQLTRYVADVYLHAMRAWPLVGRPSIAPPIFYANLPNCKLPHTYRQFRDMPVESWC